MPNNLGILQGVKFRVCARIQKWNSPENVLLVLKVAFCRKKINIFWCFFIEYVKDVVFGQTLWKWLKNNTQFFFRFLAEKSFYILLTFTFHESRKKNQKKIIPLNSSIENWSTFYFNYIMFCLVPKVVSVIPPEKTG